MHVCVFQQQFLRLYNFQVLFIAVAVVARYACLVHSTALDDLYEVYEEVFTMAGSWSRIAVALKLPESIRPLIAKKHINDPEDCLLAVVLDWLKGVHNVQKYGHPSWRVLVQAVAHPAGGANPALARSIAAKHPGTGNHHSHVTECPVMSHVLVSPVTSVPVEESDANKTVQTAHQIHSKRIVYMHMCAHTQWKKTVQLFVLLCTIS